MAELDWFENDDLFFSELATGHEWETKVGAVLVEHGVNAVVTPQRRRESVEQRSEFANAPDIVVSTADGPVVIEVKSRRFGFSAEPSSYRYSTALVDTVSGWNQKLQEPTAVVLVSQVTGEMLVIFVAATKSSWTTTRKFDRTREIEDIFYQAPKAELRPMKELVDWLRGVQTITGRETHDDDTAAPMM